MGTLLYPEEIDFSWGMAGLQCHSAVQKLRGHPSFLSFPPPPLPQPKPSAIRKALLSELSTVWPLPIPPTASGSSSTISLLAYYNSLLNSLCRLGPAETHLFASPPSPLSVGMTEAHLTQWVVGTGAHWELQDRCGQQQQQLPGPLQTSNTLAFAGFPNFALYVSSLISLTFP